MIARMSGRGLTLSLCALLLSGTACDRDRALPLVLVDAGVEQPPPDASAPPDLAQPKPCHLVADGEPVVTFQYPDPRDSWHSEGLLPSAAPGAAHRVVQVGSVKLRFGGWDDDAIWAAELDVSSWPPATVHAPSELFVSMHSPAAMLEVAPGLYGLAWFWDNDGLGPIGVRYRAIDAASWTLRPDRFLVENARLFTPPVALGDGSGRFVTVTDVLRGTPARALGLFSSDGALVASQPLDDAVTNAGLALGRTSSEVLAAMTKQRCSTSDAGTTCDTTGIDLFRVDPTAPGGALLVPISTVAMPIASRSMGSVRILSDGADHHFLSWWEAGADRAVVYAMPLTAAGRQAGPVEVWWNGPSGAWPLGSAVGPLGVVYAVATSAATDLAAGRRDVHLLVRQLVADAPVEETVFSTAYTGYAVGLVQLDAPRALVVGYSSYPDSGPSSGYGLLRRYACAEDGR